MDQRPNNKYKDNMPGGTTTYDDGTKWSEMYVWIPLNVAVEGNSTTHGRLTPA